jgi:hypothetical protein
LTFVGYAAVTASFGQWVRPHLLTPLRATSQFILPQGTGSISIGQPKGLQGAWVIWSETINRAGRVLQGQGGLRDINFSPGRDGRSYLDGIGLCPNRIPNPSGAGNDHEPPLAVQHAVQTCINSFHLRQLMLYQPENRYWTFQWIESGVFVALALALSAGTIWWVRRRLA